MTQSRPDPEGPLPSRPRAFLQRMGRRLLWGLWFALALLLVAAALPPAAPRAEEVPSDLGVERESMDIPQGGAPLRMTMTDAVYLTIRNNVNVKTNYLTRILEKFDLEQAEAKFVPNINLDGTLNLDAIGNLKSESGRMDIGDAEKKLTARGEASIGQKVPTGMDINFAWDITRTDSNKDLVEFDDDDQRRHTKSYTGETKSSWKIELAQPLLKGAGIDYNMASVRLARIREQRNILTLRDNLSALINEAVNLFFTYYQAEQNLQIQRQGLERSRRLLEINRIKVDVGRMAENDVVQAEADVASRELSLEEAVNRLDEARRRLLNHLELDPELVVDPVLEDFPEMRPNYDACMVLALLNNREYLDRTFGITESDIRYLVAENERMWELVAKVSYQETYTEPDGSSVSNKDRNLQAGLEFKTPINIYGKDKLTRERALLDAEVGKRRARLDLHKARIDLQTRVANTVRNVRMRLKLIGLAERNTELKARQLENEQTKLMVGRSTNFQVVSYQDQLLQAQQDEIAKSISYVQSLIELDQLLGTTMDTWDIEFRRQDKSLEEDIDDEVAPLLWTWW